MNKNEGKQHWYLHASPKKYFERNVLDRTSIIPQNIPIQETALAANKWTTARAQIYSRKYRIRFSCFLCTFMYTPSTLFYYVQPQRHTVCAKCRMLF